MRTDVLFKKTHWLRLIAAVLLLTVSFVRAADPP